MPMSDTCVTIVPYFKAKPGKLAEVKALCEAMVERTRSEPGCLFYGFSFDGDEFHCREGYGNADGALAHLGNIDPLLKDLLGMADITRLEIHGVAAELDKLREPVKSFGPRWFVLECGFRR